MQWYGVKQPEMQTSVQHVEEQDSVLHNAGRNQQCNQTSYLVLPSLQVQG
jgi:hypothetical protein